MKKQIGKLLLGAVGVGMLMLAGCGGEEPMAKSKSAAVQEVSPEEMVRAAHEMLEQADGFQADYSAVFSMESNENIQTEGIVTFQKEPLSMHVDTTMIYDDMTQESSAYLEQNEDAVNLYMNYGGQWTEMTMSEEDAMEAMQFYHTLYNMEAVFSSAENWTVAAEKDGLLHLSGVIPKEKFYDVERYTKFFRMAGMSNLSETYFSEVGDVPVRVVLDQTGTPVSYEIDLTDALEIVTNHVLKELNGEDASMDVKKYVLSSEITQLGNVTAESVPYEAKDTAINYEREISLLNSEP